MRNYSLIGAAVLMSLAVNAKAFNQIQLTPEQKQKLQKQQQGQGQQELVAREMPPDPGQQQGCKCPGGFAPNPKVCAPPPANAPTLSGPVGMPTLAPTLSGNQVNPNQQITQVNPNQQITQVNPNQQTIDNAQIPPSIIPSENKLNEGLTIKGLGGKNQKQAVSSRRGAKGPTIRGRSTSSYGVSRAAVGVPNEPMCVPIPSGGPRQDSFGPGSMGAFGADIKPADEKDSGEALGGCLACYNACCGANGARGACLNQCSTCSSIANQVPQGACK